MSTLTPKFSVIIPSYNRAHCIRKTLDSILAQTYPFYEIVVVDDGSTDDTRAVVESCGPRVRYVYQKNQGAPSAMNTGVRHAKGEFVYFLGSDDLLFPDTLERHARYIEKHPEVAMVYGRYESFLENGDPLPRAYFDFTCRNWICRPGVNDLYLDWLLDCYCPIQTASIRKAAFDDVGGFDRAPEISGAEEYDLFLRIAARGKIGFLDGNPLARYCYHFSRTPAEVDRVIIAILKKHLKRVESGALPVPRTPAIRNIHLRLAKMHFILNDVTGGRSHFLKSIGTDPRALFFFHQLRLFLASFLPGGLKSFLSAQRKRFFPTEFETLCALYPDKTVSRGVEPT